MDSMASGGRDGSEAAFSARRVRLAMLLQCAPLLCAVTAWSGDAGLALYSAIGGSGRLAQAVLWTSLAAGRLPERLLQVMGATALLAGSGYATLGLRRRFRCAALLGALSYMTFQGFDSAAHLTAAVLLLGVVAVTAADLWRLRRRRDAAGSSLGVAEIVGTIVVCALTAFVILVVSLLASIVLTCGFGVGRFVIDCP